MSETGKTALVVGGGPAGLEAAIKIGQAGYPVILVEKESKPGGYLTKLCSTFPRWDNPQDLLGHKLSQVEKLGGVTLLTDTTVVYCQADSRGFTVELNNGKSVEVEAVVLATGFDYFDVGQYGEYGYGFYSGVVNAVEFEAQLKEWSFHRDSTKPPQAIAFFKCIGSRDRAKGYPYCSRICCMYTARQAAMVKEMFPQTACYVFYMDIRAAGKGYEEFVRSTIEEKRVRYVRGRPAKVLPEGGRLQIRAEDTLMGNPIELEVDLVVLAGAIVPKPETVQLAGIFGAATDQYGFLDGELVQPFQAGSRVYFAGGCGFPVDIHEALEQGAAAAAEVFAFFNRSD